MNVKPQRVSRTAIWGAIWAALVPFAVLPFIGFMSPPGWTPSWWTVTSASVLSALGLSSPFATTILGWVAVAQIRRSAGRLYGLGLAVFDGLLFPLLIFDGAIAWVSWAAIQLILNAFLDSGQYPGAHLGAWTRAVLTTLLNYHLTVALLIALPVAALLNIMTIRHVWRDANRLVNTSQSPSATFSPSGADSPNRSGCASMVLAIFVIVILGTVGLLTTTFILSRSSRRIDIPLPPVNPERSAASTPIAPSPDMAPTETGAETFGPVIEHVVSSADTDEQGLVFFDMETGATLKPPFRLKFFPNQCPYFVEFTSELRQWIKDHDVDVLLHLGEKNWEMMTLEMDQGFAGQPNSWENYTPHDAIAIFARLAAQGRVRDEVPACSGGHDYRNGFGAFDAFRTRSNTIGVYQYEGIQNTTRRGVGFRCRLVQFPKAPYGQSEGRRFSVKK